MFEIYVKDSFSAAHQLKECKGKCERIHGHNWNVEVAISSSILSGGGMVVDFKHVQKKLSKVLQTLDHKLLNKCNFFKNSNPTAENVAYYIYRKLKSLLKVKNGVKIREVVVSEMNNARAKYIGD
ncbi:MAG: 6-carboxytetrahydropterin synthase QueD [bacterium]